MTYGGFHSIIVRYNSKKIRLTARFVKLYLAVTIKKYTFTANYN
jgi:hypothetical protein